jgi:uncharacterized damage-inducible protein DinB
MTRDEAKELFEYGSWATAAYFRAAAALPEEERTATAAGSFPSVIATLAHIVGAEWIWLRRWRGESPTAAPAWAAAPSLADLEARLREIEADRAAFVEGLADGDLERPVAYRSLAGKPATDPLGRLVRHVVNHSTYHRGQLAAQLRGLGHTPPSTDLVRYHREPR